MVTVGGLYVAKAGTLVNLGDGSKGGRGKRKRELSPHSGDFWGQARTPHVLGSMFFSVIPLSLLLSLLLSP
jgi:hypothetical protein